MADEYQLSAYGQARGPLSTNSEDGLAFWTPVLGPTAMLLAYFLASQVEGEGPGKVLLSQMALDLGVIPSKARAALNRLARFSVAELDLPDIQIHLQLPYPQGSPKPNAEPLTLTVPEAADLLGISRGAGYDAARRGELPTVRIGRRYLVPRKALIQLLEGED